MTLLQLNQSLIKEKKYNQAENLQVPSEEQLNFPEKVLQFGSGALLRGFTDFFIDQAHRKNLFDGRVVIVNSTRSGRGAAFNDQDGLFTLRVEGFAKGETVKEYMVNGAISRAISAADEWDEVLKCAKNPELSVITSNTTEVGITLKEDDDLQASPPASFPGKLTAFLYQRYEALGGTNESGLVILPTELILDNGSKLKEIVLTLAEKNNLGTDFTQWLKKANIFCNTLVDRIVPGTPDEKKQQAIFEELGFTDDLLTVSEVYRLFAIEGNQQLLYEKAPFLKVDESIIISEDITPYRERKLRILNGGHTISVAAGYLCGLATVYDCMQDEVMKKFISQVIHDEIVPSLDIDQQMAKEFANDVLDRFRNPFLNHQLLSITLQYTSKMSMRNGATFVRYYQKYDKVPELMCAGFAAYLLFARPQKVSEGKYYGIYEGKEYLINDDKAEYLMKLWASVNTDNGEEMGVLVKNLLSDEELWGSSLPEIDGLTAKIAQYLNQYIQSGVKSTLAKVLE